MYSEEIIVNDREYKLQHPGNREYQKIAGSLLKINDSGTEINMIPLMEYAFEHVVIPVNGSPKLCIDGRYKEGKKPGMDTTKQEMQSWILEYEGVWAKILPSFLRGTLESFIFETDYHKRNKGADSSIHPELPSKAKEQGE
jgi:hypothetical protein